MAFTRVAALLHVALSDVTTAQHHTATVAGDLNLADLAARAHADLSDSPADAHHASTHTVLSHSDGADACKIATGAYTGDGATSQAITGIGFTVKAVTIIRRSTVASEENVFFTTDVIVDDNAAGLSYLSRAIESISSSLVTNEIIDTGSDGFTVDDAGTDQNPNVNAAVYNFICFGIEV